MITLFYRQFQHVPSAQWLLIDIPAKPANFMPFMAGFPIFRSTFPWISQGMPSSWSYGTWYALVWWYPGDWPASWRHGRALGLTPNWWCWWTTEAILGTVIHFIGWTVITVSTATVGYFIFQAWRGRCCCCCGYQLELLPKGLKRDNSIKFASWSPKHHISVVYMT